jgi:hypothetical protein
VARAAYTPAALQVEMQVGGLILSFPLWRKIGAKKKKSIKSM